MTMNLSGVTIFNSGGGGGGGGGCQVSGRA